jgi:hypothetical protein
MTKTNELPRLIDTNLEHYVFIYVVEQLMQRTIVDYQIIFYAFVVAHKAIAEENRGKKWFTTYLYQLVFTKPSLLI